MDQIKEIPFMDPDRDPGDKKPTTLPGKVKEYQLEVQHVNITVLHKCLFIIHFDVFSPEFISFWEFVSLDPCCVIVKNYSRFTQKENHDSSQQNIDKVAKGEFCAIRTGF